MTHSPKEIALNYSVKILGLQSCESIEQLKRKYEELKSDLKSVEKTFIELRDYSQYSKLVKSLKQVYRETIVKFNVSKKECRGVSTFLGLHESCVLAEEIERIHNLMRELSFQFIEAPLIDTRNNCFDFLNMKNHPSINENEMFFIDENFILRTHATNFQAHLGKHILQCDIEQKFYNLGQVFRRDDSSRHLYVFHQLDIVIVQPSRTKNDVDIKTRILHLTQSLFEKNVEYRVRSNYFPFTLPSYEIDVWNNGKYVEIAGFGYMHDSVKERLCIRDSDIVIAAGFGIERIVMMRFGLEKIKDLLHE